MCNDRAELPLLEEREEEHAPYRNPMASRLMGSSARTFNSTTSACEILAQFFRISNLCYTGV